MQSDLTVLYPYVSHLGNAHRDLYFPTNPTYQDAWLSETVSLTLHILLTSLSVS